MVRPADSRQRGHEVSDASAPWLAAAVVAVLAGTALLMAATWALLVLIAGPTPREQVLAGEGAGVPHWEHPPADLRRLRRRERRELSSYAWIDSRTDALRIPIERAMTLVAQERARGGRDDAAPGRGDRGDRGR